MSYTQDTLRSAFRDFVIDFYEAAPDVTPAVILDTERHSAQWLLGRMWNDTDIMPGFTRRTLAELTSAAEPMTYAQGARRLKAILPA